MIKYLLNEDGMEEVSTQNIGEALTDDYCAINGQTSFSPDGTLIAKFCSLTGLDVMDFNRETGEVSNNRHLEIPTNYATSGVAFSPSSQFVYVSTKDSLWQVDVTEPNLEDGLEFIDRYDGFQDPFSTNIVKQQLGPDCRIYISSTNGVSSMHVIRNPDAKGKDCDFRQHYLDLPYDNGILSMPNFPHFRVDEDDVCDPTITGLFDLPIEVVSGLDVYPNPTSGGLTIELPDVVSGWVSIMDLHGRVLQNLELVNHKKSQLDVSLLDPGFYFVKVITADNQTYVEKFIKN